MKGLRPQARAVNSNKSTPEPGTKYTLRFYVFNVLKHIESGISGTSFTWTTESDDSGSDPGVYNQSGIEITPEAVRDGITSYNKYQFRISRL